jgi:hypothetical protein
MMIGGVAQQSPMRLHNQLLSRSDGCSQGRREPTRSAREPLTASPSAGYPCARHLTQLLKPDTLDPSGCQRKSQVLHISNDRLLRKVGFSGPLGSKPSVVPRKGRG